MIVGGMGREDDDIKVDNVICRTPARNAQNLDAVKNEILEMVDRAVRLLIPLLENLANELALSGFRIYCSSR